MHTITLGEGITITSPAEPTVTYGSTGYYKNGTTITLTNNATGAPAGYQYGYSVSAGTLSGSTLIMPAADVTISLALAAIDWATESTGDADNPYMIYNKDQLDLLAHRVNSGTGDEYAASGYSGKYFRLANDIAYTYTKAWNEATTEDDNNYEPIGYYDGENNRYFQGDFDGAGHTISGIRIHINSDRSFYQGIFGLTDGANIHGLRLANARITGYVWTGGIVGDNQGTVTDCHVANNVCIHTDQTDAWYHGGIAGENSGTVERCTSAATLTIPTDATDRRYYGAIAGNNSGTLRDNLAIGATVPATSNNTHGAIVGNESGTLQRNYYTACTVAGTENATGVGCQNYDVTTNDGAVPYMTVTVAPAGYGTLYDSRIDLTLPAGVKARIVTDRGDSEGTLSYETIADGDTDTKTIPAGTAVMLCSAEAAAAGEDRSYQLPLLPPTTDSRDFSTQNKLHGSDVAATTTGGDVYYKLTYSNNNDNFGWYWGAADGAAFTSPAHKAWLALSTASGNARAFIGLPDWDEATGITTTDLTDLTDSDGTWYDMNGRRLNAKPTAKGLYIKNGKKVIIK